MCVGGAGTVGRFKGGGLARNRGLVFLREGWYPNAHYAAVVASGNSKEVLFMPMSLILVILAWSLYLFIISRIVDLSKFGFFGLPIQFGASPEVFSTIFI